LERKYIKINEERRSKRRGKERMKKEII